MKTLCIAIILLIASTVQAATFYGNDGYSRRVRVACEKATMRGGHLDTPAAKGCFYEVVEAHREQELTDSQIELNRQKAEWYRRHRNNLNYRGFPCEEVK